MVVTYAFGVRASDRMACSGHMITRMRVIVSAPPGAGAGPKKKPFCSVLYVDHPGLALLSVDVAAEDT